MPKGPEFLAANAARHRDRTSLWNERCARVDVEALRVKLSIDFVRARGGLTYEERTLLKACISEIQKPKEKRERIIDERRRRWNVA